MWVYMLKSNDQALGAFKMFKALAKNETEKKLKILRTDHGSEFTSWEFEALCEGKGIARHLATPYTPQQNGVVEQRNRTVLAMAMSLLKSKFIPGRMWGEAVKHAVYVLNHVPTKVMIGITPYEVWTCRKPSVEHLKVFGCVAHMKVPSVHTKKLDDRNTTVVYLGGKACRLYDPRSGKMLE